MGILRSTRFTNPFRIDIPNKTTAFRDDLRVPGQRRALGWSCLAATISVVVAGCWLHWSTVHVACIACGIAAALFVAPWVGDREAAAPLNSENSDLEVVRFRSTPSAGRRRAA